MGQLGSLAAIHSGGRYVATSIAVAAIAVAALARLAAFTRLAGFSWLTGFAILTAFAIFAARLAIFTRFALRAGFLRLLLLRLLLLAAIGIELVIAAVHVVALATLLILFFEARAGFAQHPKIVIGELEIIFGVDPVALALRVRGQVLVLFVQLGSVAPRAIVDPAAIALVAATRALLLLTTTAATAAVSLTIVHQGLFVLST
ncbi:hypothetical protein FHT02_003517 [Sphingomonas xinjiangensis]|uniref:Uncharacterized protein n=1 Tax=Sphingomonas xinjiangensis TaxID=643568 RepID=A0A840YPI9_9SPHN|nr:hypothetical protein [Sphingomonas xinjiangensis]